ncbi:MAG: ribosome silencing factor [Caldisericia bacterium]|nr:ribosome silencing factor [Caldisericia bacterium]
MKKTTYTRRNDIDTQKVTTEQKKELIIELLKDMKAEDIVILKVDHLTSITNYFIICTADNSTLLKTIVYNLEKEMRAKGIRILYQVKEKSPEWTVVDFSDIIIHVFMPEERKKYALEDFWSQAPKTVIDY